MDVNTLYEMLEPYIIRTIQSNKITLSSTSGGTGGLEPHALFGTYHTGQLDESQALWVDSKIVYRIADHAAQVDAHHAKVHSILDSANHVVSGGAALDIIGQSAANTIARITPSSAPGAAAAILRTDASGVLSLVNLVTPLISTGTSVNMIVAPGGDLTLAPVGGDTFVTGSFKVTGNANVTGDLDVDTSVYGNVSVITPNIHNTSTLAITSGSTITLDSATNMIHVLPSNNFQTDNFASQLAGWRLTYSGELDARYIYADQLKIKILIADMEQALAGSQIIAKSVTTLSRSFVAPHPGATTTLYLEDLPSAEDMATYESGDIVCVREYSRAGGGLSVTNCWGTVTSYTNLTGKEQQWTFTRSGTYLYATIALRVAPAGPASSGTSSRVFSKPVGLATDDVMIATYVHDGSSDTITPPAGWTLLGYTNGTDINMAFYYKVAGGSEPSTYTFSTVNNHACAGTIVAYGNVDIANPIGGFNAQPNSSSTSLASPSVASATAKDMLLFLGGVSNNTAATPPTDTTELLDTGATGIRIYAAEQLLTTSGSYSKTATLASAQTSIGAIVMLRPITTGMSVEAGAMTVGTTIAKGSIVVDYGIAGNGWYEVTAVDGLYGSNSPYSRIVTFATHPAVDPVVRTQNGHLKGLFGVANEFGFYAGDGTAATNAYLRLSSHSSSFNNIPITMYQSGTAHIKLDAESGLNLKLASAEDAMTAIRWQETIGISTDGAKIDVFDGGDSTQMIISLEAITASPVGLMTLRAYNAVGTRPATITLTSYDSDTLYSNIGINAKTIAIGSYSGPGTSAVYINASATGSLRVQCGANVGTNTIIVTNDGTLSVGNLSADYSPIDSTWNTTGSTLLLNALNYTTIGFHDSSNRVDFIRVGAATMVLGYDGGWGSPYVTIPGGLLLNRGGSSNGALTIGGTAYDSHFSFGTDEHTYLRGGKSTSNVYINDTSTGLVSISAGGGATTFGGRIGEAWQNLSFGSGWVDYGGAYQIGQYKKVGDLIFLRGLVKRTSGSGTTITTLPSGYRPPAQLLFGVHTNTGFGRLDIDSSGNVSLQGGGADWVQLNGLVFSNVG